MTAAWRTTGKRSRLPHLAPGGVPYLPIGDDDRLVDVIGYAEQPTP
jgi:hypothetical protein